MKAVILAGGEGTRLRPLTLSVPKPVVPVVDRPFLRHQLDLLARASISEIVFSVAYQPERIQAVFGDGTALGRRIHYAVEETPLGTGGAVKNAERHLDETTVVFNGDVLTDVDLPAVVRAHRESGAKATLVLTPVPNPAAYGLVETDASGRVKSFIEKPSDPSQITTDTVNAGIYVLDTSTLALMPPGQNHSIERAFFPALLRRGDLVRAWVHRGYWIDIGTPEKYLQVHRDILQARFPVHLEGEPRNGGWAHSTARIDAGAELEGRFYVGPGCRIDAGAHVGPDAVLTAGVTVATGAWVRDSVVWEGSTLAESCRVDGSLLGARVHVGRHACLAPGAVLGEATVISDHSRTR
ncbi:MAG: nucleotidyl transferase [Acidobacteria bacterium]|nr:MAG: nucleotidyl transferase [Acidobacteriota bacterium]